MEQHLSEMLNLFARNVNLVEIENSIDLNNLAVSDETTRVKYFEFLRSMGEFYISVRGISIKLFNFV